MDDLISRSVLKEAFSKNSIFEKITDSRGMNVLEIIDEQPTAYSVENVVEELEKAKFLMPPENEGHYADNGLFLDDAIKIVRKGGVE